MSGHNNFRFVILSVFALFVIGLSFVSAANVNLTINTNSVNEDVYTMFNVSVHNLDAGINANITQVNITLPASFSFAAGANYTDSNSFLVWNGTTGLSWRNATVFVINGSAINYFVFNASAATPGTFNITVTTVNTTGSVITSKGIVLAVNDTTTPQNVSFVSPTNATYTNLSTSYIFFNVTTLDNGNISRILVRLLDSSRTEVNSTNHTISSFSGNFTGHADGTYYLNVTSNDSANNINGSERIITIDTTAPQITLEESDATRTTLSIDISIVEAGTGVNGYCSVQTDDGNAPDISGSGNSQSFSDSDLSCGTEYTYTVTCTDFMGREGSSGEETFTTDACSDSSGGGGGGGGGSSWKTTFDSDDKELSEMSVSKVLAAKNRIRLKVKGQLHYVGALEVAADSAKIQVMSTPQEATLKVGETKLFDIDADNIYDLKVTLVSISAGKATVQTEYVQEAVSSGTTDSGSTGTDTTATTDTVGSDTGAPAAEDATASGMNYKWIIIALILVIVIVGVIYFTRKKK